MDKIKVNPETEQVIVDLSGVEFNVFGTIKRVAKALTAHDGEVQARHFENQAWQASRAVGDERSWEAVVAVAKRWVEVAGR